MTDGIIMALAESMVSDGTSISPSVTSRIGNSSSSHNAIMFDVFPLGA